MDATTVEATYKTREVEGIADIYFYRKVGFWLAQRFARRNISPAAVTFLGGIFGLAAGHLYFYPFLAINLAGLGLHMVSNALDNADGQLARLTNKQSHRGRILDSVVDHVVWFGIYLHLALRHIAGGGSSWVWLLAAAAGISHGAQSAAADYCRNAYLYFRKGRSKTNFDSAGLLREKFRAMPWAGRGLEKAMLFFYMRGISQQEKLMPDLKKLHDLCERSFPEEIPSWLRSRYDTMARPIVRWCGWMMSNTRMLLLFFLFIIFRPTWFFWFEITIFNALLWYVCVRQRNTSDSIGDLVEHPPPASQLS